jgi:hypothetical protein
MMVALINCPECDKQISDKADSCPNCGCPINLISLKQVVNHEIALAEELECPDFPDDMSVGKVVGNWFSNVTVFGTFKKDLCTPAIITNGVFDDGKVVLCEYGLQIESGRLIPSLTNVHFSQMMSIRETSEEELAQSGKSVLGRATVGGLLLGPVGAVIGGMSGLGKTTKQLTKKILVTSFWDAHIRRPQLIVLSVNPICDIKNFLVKYEEQMQKFNTGNL